MPDLDVCVVLLTQTLNVFGYMILLPVAPYFAMHLGAGAFDISLINASYSFAQSVSMVLVGAISDRTGRKPVMVGGLVLAVLFNFLQSRVNSVTSFVLLRLGLGVACSTGPVEMAYITDKVTEDAERTKVISLQAGCITAGGALGPAVAGIFASYGFPVLCYAMTAIVSFNLVLGAVFWKEPNRVAGGNEQAKEQSEALLDAESLEKPVSSAIMADAVIPKLLALSLITSFSWMVSFGPEPIFFTEHFGFDEQGLAIFFTIIPTAMCATTGLMPSIIQCLGDARACMVASLGAAAASLTLFTNRAWWEPYFFATLGAGVCGTIVNVSSMNVLTKRCPADQRGKVLGLSQSLAALGAFLGPLIGGLMYERLGNFTPCQFTSACFIVGAAICWTFPAGAGKDTTPIPPAEPDGTAFRRSRRASGPRFLAMLGGTA